MAWIKTGTVSVTAGSNVVAGDGTGWMGLVLAGEGFDAPDGRIYEIAEVRNSNELWLAADYLGPSLAGAGYQIIPTASVTKVLAARVSTLIGEFDGVPGAVQAQARQIDLLQTALDFKAPLASPAFTGTPTGITKTHVGLGSVDNTSDANKPVSTAQAAAIAARYGKDNILGAVGQSASVPTGAVIERGSNANGEYVRFADGTQICTRSHASFAAFPADNIIQLPIAFSSFDWAGASVIPNQDIHQVLTVWAIGNSWYVRCPTANTQNTKLIAIGRWY